MLDYLQPPAMSEEENNCLNGLKNSSLQGRAELIKIVVHSNGFHLDYGKSILQSLGRAATYQSEEK
jgi:hypothetical protein